MRILVLIFLVFWSGVSLAQEHCTSIENDIARLACFDEAFAQTQSGEALQPVDAFTELATVLTSSGTKWNGLPAIVDSSFDDESCSLAIVRTESAGCSAFECKIRQNSVWFNAGDMDSISPGRDGYLIQMERGKEIRTGGFETGIGGQPATLEDLAIRTSNTVRFFVSATPEDIEKFTSPQPSAEIGLLTTESQVDADKILAAIAALSDACRTR